MLGELIPVGGGDAIPLLGPKLVIGRRSSCDIVLAFPNISSQHCALEFIDGYWRIRDLNSSNGVKVNGERHEQKWLYPGDEISVAKNHFEIDYMPTGDKPPVEDDDPFEMGLLEKAGLQQESRERRKSAPLPSATQPVSKKSFGSEEDAAMDWLMGDD